MLICKKCGFHQEDEMTIKYMKRKWPHTEEHDIYYFCGACLDNATDEEYENMMKLMDNPRFNRAVKDLTEALDKSMSYDEWAGREYGEDKVDIDDTADNLASNGIVKDVTIVRKLLINGILLLVVYLSRKSSMKFGLAMVLLRANKSIPLILQIRFIMN